MPNQLDSERVIVEAPLSYAGSAKRIMRMSAAKPAGPAHVALVFAAVLLVVLAWAFVTCWYVFWGLWLVPYRLTRRGQRSRKRQSLQHRETLAVLSAIEQRASGQAHEEREVPAPQPVRELPAAPEPSQGGLKQAPTYERASLEAEPT